MQHSTAESPQSCKPLRGDVRDGGDRADSAADFRARAESTIAYVSRGVLPLPQVSSGSRSRSSRSRLSPSHLTLFDVLRDVETSILRTGGLAVFFRIYKSDVVLSVISKVLSGV